METILSIQNLEKSYKAKKVIKDISFDVKKGEILCILGPNGAGKSTTINILTGALDYENGLIKSGKENVHNHIRRFKSRLGIVPQDIALYEELFISLATVKTHILNIYRKLEVSSRVAAVEKGHRLGLL